MNGFSSNVVMNPPTGIGNATVSITNSTITDNTGVGGAVLLPGQAVNYVGASGGIAGLNFGNQLTINVAGVTIANNMLDSNLDQIAAAGGIAVVNELGSGLFALNVNQTSIVNNATPACGLSACDSVNRAGGGIAVTQANRFLPGQVLEVVLGW